MLRTRFALLAIFALFLSFAFSAVSVLAVPATAPAAPTAGASIPAGQIGGATTAIVMAGGNLYFNVGPRIARTAVSNSAPLTPTLPAAYSGILPGIPEDIKFANGYLYIALGRAGVAVVDATTLEIVNTQPLSGTASATALAIGANSGHLYLATGLNGIVEYSIELDHVTLTYLQTKTFTSPQRRITDVETRFLPSAGDEFLFAAANNASPVPANRGGILKFNITTEPVLSDPVTIKEQIDVNDLAVTDNYVFAAGENAFYTLDTTALGTTSSFATLALPGRAVKVALRPGAQDAYLLDAFGGIDVIDVTTPLSPTKLTANPFYTYGVVMDLTAAEFTGDTNTYLYLADLYAGLSIASAPQAAPENLNLDRPGYLTPMPAITSVVGAAYPQAYVYSIASTQWTVDTSDLFALTTLGNGIVPATTINAIVPYSSSLLVADEFGLTRYQTNPGGEPSNPEALAFPGNGSANDVVVSWPYAVVADGSEGLVVVDLSDTMVITGSAPAPLFNSDFRSVDVQGHYAYVGDYNGTLLNVGQLRIYDLTDPAAPVATGSVTQTGILDVKVSGNFAFMAVGPAGIRVADVSNPAAPVVISTDDYTGTLTAQKLAIYRNNLFVAQSEGGVQMLAFNPTTGQLRLVATIPTSGAAQDLAWETGRLYVADDYAGLMIFQIGNDLAITKTAPAIAYQGQPFTYTLNIGNVGIVTATNVVVTDVLPANLSLLSDTGCTHAVNVVTCTLPSLAAGNSASFNLVVQPTLTESYTNTAYVISDQLDVEPANNSSTATTTVLPVADLSLSKAASASAVYAGDQLTYTLTVTNAGPSTATGVVLTDTLPAGVTLVQASLGCSGTTTIVCNLGNLSVGQAQNVSIVVATTGQAVPTITNTATAAAAEMDLTPATATAMTTVQPSADLALSKADSPDPVPAGARLTYILTLSNNGPSAATSVLVTDTLPAGVILAAADAGCTGTTTISCAIGSMNAGTTVTRSIAVTVTASAASVITNTAIAGSNVFDPNLANNSASTATTVSPVADLSISKSASPITGTAGLPLTYSLVVRNFGPSTATSVVLTDSLPTSVQFVSASGATCNGTSSVVCNLGNMLAGEVTTVTLTVMPMTSGTITNVAVVSSAVFDPNLANNTTAPVITPVKAHVLLPIVRR